MRPKIAVYFARAMDEISTQEIIDGDKEYSSLLKPLGATIVNPYHEQDNYQSGSCNDIVNDDLSLLEKSDILLADLSIEGYVYVGCIFEIVQACMWKIPTIIVCGKGGLKKRKYLRAFCNYLADDASEAIEYIKRNFQNIDLHNVR